MGVTSQFQAQAQTLGSKGNQRKMEKHAFPHFFPSSEPFPAKKGLVIDGNFSFPQKGKPKIEK